jgi:glycosyltransferase involved in cell wall biosynthesis
LPDGLILISTFLKEYFADKVRKDCRLLLVPSIVEMGLYPEPSSRQEGSRRIVTYCGNLYNDGEVERLLQAFAIASKDLPVWKLQVIGDTSDRQRFDDLQTVVRSLNLNDRVEFPGSVARRDIPGRLAMGDIMALPRASGTFSTAGFPTKLAEYLATGRPVVVTSTGDIPRYLEDGKSAYLVPPDDVDAFADRLRYVMLHLEEASKVGSCGRQAALREFDCNTHSKRILNFISDLENARTKSVAANLAESPKGRSRSG